MGRKQCMGCMEFYEDNLELCPHCGYDEFHENSHVLHLKPGTVLHKRYIVGNSIGYGSFGVTYVGWDKLLRHKVAIKEYLPSEFATRVISNPELILPDSEKQITKYERGMKRFRREAEKLAKLGEIDGVVYIYDTFDENHTTYIVMEYLEGETLAAYMEREGVLSEQRAMSIVLPLLNALQLVHEHDIIHRDISPDNIFISKDSSGNEKVKLIDFGAARFASSSHSKSLTVLLRPGYSPEEQYRSSGEQGSYTDIYAIGAVLYHMVTGQLPPDALERRTAIEHNRKELLENPSTFNSDLSENFETAILNAMNVRIEDRTATADEFVSELISFEKVRRRGSSIKKIDFIKWPLWAKILAPLGGVAALAVVIGISFFLKGIITDEASTLPDGYARVPYFVGMSLDEAKEKAENKKLLINQAGSEFSPNVEENNIVSQDTTEGFIVTENSVINLTTSTGIETYPFPDVVGMEISEARKALECMGLEVKVKKEEKPGLISNAVVSQNVKPYSDITYGQTVTIHVTPDDNYKEKNMSAMPNFVGKTYEDALELASKKNVALVVNERTFSKKYDDHEIVKQSPITKGSNALEITVNEAYREFPMPDLLYKSQDIAIQLLKNIGIKGKTKLGTSEIVGIGLIYEQNIKKGSKLKPGTEVVIKSSKGTTPFSMINVKGLTEEKAKEALQKKNLSVTVQYGYDKNIKEGSVISQNVKKGTDICRGSNVVITVCSHKDLVKVADVLYKSKAEAKSKLESQGLTIKVSEAYSDTVKKGSVINQLPAAGTKQTKNTIILLTISKGPEPVKNSDGGNKGISLIKPGKVTWSDWSPQVPSGKKYETKTQYRSRSRNTTTSSSSSMSGWTLYNTTTSYGGWGSWSSWSTSKPDSSDTKSVESKKQYMYADYTTKKSTSSSMSGFKQVGSETSYGGWGSWSSWSLNAVDANDTREVEKTALYRYYYYKCPSCGAHEPFWTINDNYKSDCGKSIPSSAWHEGWFATPYSKVDRKSFSYTSIKYYTYSLDGSLWIFGARNLNDTAIGTKDADSDSIVIKQGYRYRTRSKTTTYTYEGWVNRDWSDSTSSTSSTVKEVGTRTLYRYRTRSKNTTYHYEKWGDWSEYTDNPLYEDKDTEVQKRTLYRYQK